MTDRPVLVKNVVMRNCCGYRGLRLASRLLDVIDHQRRKFGARAGKRINGAVAGPTAHQRPQPAHDDPARSQCAGQASEVQWVQAAGR